MSNVKNTSFQDRRAASDAAKSALVAKFKARPAADSPEMLAKQAERATIAAERLRRKEERDQAKREEAERVEQQRLAEAAAAEEAAGAARRAKEEADNALIKQMLDYEAEMKSKRDARYAARKARSK
ncbi:DUF6481 family protein [Aliihoeflea sp. PC F10.4]